MRGFETSSRCPIDNPTGNPARTMGRYSDIRGPASRDSVLPLRYLRSAWSLGLTPVISVFARSPEVSGVHLSPSTHG